MILEKSLKQLYRVSPISLPRREDRHRPTMKASTTAEMVSRMGGMEMEKKGGRLLPAVLASSSSTPALMKDGNRVSATAKEKVPPIKVDP